MSGSFFQLIDSSRDACFDTRRYRLKLARENRDYYCSDDFAGCSTGLAMAGSPQPLEIQRVSLDGAEVLYTLASIQQEDLCRISRSALSS